MIELIIGWLQACLKVEGHLRWGQYEPTHGMYYHPNFYTDVPQGIDVIILVGTSKHDAKPKIEGYL